MFAPKVARPGATKSETTVDGAFTKPSRPAERQSGADPAAGRLLAPHPIDRDFCRIPVFGRHTPIDREGAPLAGALRSRIESRIGTRLGEVSVHRGQESARAATAVGASAFTLGDHIVLGGGLDPAAPRNFFLLAHEAAHVAQQAGARGPWATPPTRAGAPEEREAETAALGLGRPAARGRLALAAAPLLSPEPKFKELWPSLEQARAQSDRPKAEGLARQLVDAPYDFDDYLQHGVALAAYLQGNNEPALAARVLQRVRDVWQIQFISRDRKLPPKSVWGLLDNGPDPLIKMGEDAARAGRDEEAVRYLGAAHEILSYYAIEFTDARLAKMEANAVEHQSPTTDKTEIARRQALVEAQELPNFMLRVAQYGNLQSIYDAMRRIYGVYVEVEREALATGDAASAAAARGRSEELHRRLRAEYSWGEPQAAGPISQAVLTPVEIAEVTYTDTPRGPGLKLHGANNAETDLTALPGLPSPKEIGTNVQVQNLGNLQGALMAQTQLQAELAREPEIRKAFGDKPVDLNDTAQRLKAWRIMYDVFGRSGGNTLGALMALIGRYQKAYTVHTGYNVRDWGVSYLDTTMPTDLAGRVEKDCGVYALTVAWDVFVTAKRSTPKLGLEFELFSMLEHVALVITDAAAGNFYLVNNNTITGPHTGDKLAQVAPLYGGIRGLDHTVGPTVPVALGTTKASEASFRSQAWDRYKASADWSLSPPPIPPDVEALRKTDPAAYNQRILALREDRYRAFYALQEAFDRGAGALDATVDALAAQAGDAALLDKALAPVVDQAAALAVQFHQLGPAQPIAAGSKKTQALLPPKADYVFTLKAGQSVHPLVRVARAVLRLQTLGGQPSAKASALVQFCDAIPPFKAQLDSYRAAGATGPF